MTTVLLDKKLAKVPAVHAFVIGVGDYPALQGGSKFSANVETWGLGQLVAAPQSAMAFAKWLADDFVLTAGVDGPDRPLGSLEVLISQKGAAPKFKSKTIDRASIQNVKDAFDGWFDRAATNEQNLLLFYFSGHGFNKERDCLLLDGFSGKKKNPFDDVIDFENFERAMNDCAPRQQCWLIDACRNTSDELRKRVGQERGDPLLVAQDPPPHDAPRDSAIIRATAINQTAHALPGGLTRFTSALLRILKGAGCSDLNERWEVRTDNIVPNLNALLRFETKTKTLPPQEVRGPGNESLGFAFHVPPKPMVPVVIRCEPEDQTKNAKLRWVSKVKPTDKKDRKKEAAVWETELALDSEYEFIATFDDGTERKKVEVTQPPLHQVKL